MEQYLEFVSNHYILSAGWAVVFVMLIYSFLGARLRGYANANPDVVTQLINRENAVMVDVREDNEYVGGHIINSVHIPIGYFRDRLKELDKYKSDPIIVGCKTGQRSSQACVILKKAGFEKVYNLSGGVSAWQADNLPLTKK